MAIQDKKFVQVFKSERVREDDPKLVKFKWIKVPIYVAVFHQFGCDYEEDENFGNFSTAIVELIDGTVQNVPVELIKFIDISFDEMKEFVQHPKRKVE